MTDVYAESRLDALRNLRREGYAVIEKDALDRLREENKRLRRDPVPRCPTSLDGHPHGCRCRD